MKFIDVKNGKGTADDLFVADGAIPKIGAGQALVKVTAFGLNRMDIYQRNGGYPLPPGASEVLGVEFAGTIEKIHAEGNHLVTDGTGHKFEVGDKVLGLVTGGAYAEYVAATTQTLLHQPEGMADTVAAGIPEVWFTATQVVELVGELEKGQSLMFHAGASSVGIAAVQLAQLIGARRVFATVGSDDKKEFLKTLNIGDEKDVIVPINYNTEDFVEVVKKYEPNGVDLIIDPVGASYFNRNLDAVARDGTLVLMGTMGGTVVEKMNMGVILYKRVKVLGTTLRSRTRDYQMRLRDLIATQVIPQILSGKLQHHVDNVFPLSKITDAHKTLEANNTKGKIIVVTKEE